MFNLIKRLLCRHRWTDISTEENRKAGYTHLMCVRCRRLITAWPKDGKLSYTATPKLK